MRFSSYVLPSALLLVALVLPDIASAKFPFYGPILSYPPGSENSVIETCALGWSAVIVVINNIISFLITIAITLVAPVMIAYAGFLYVVNPISPSGISKAKDVLLNTVIGIIVVLGAYLLVTSIMAVLYKPADFSKQWYDLVVGDGDVCLVGGVSVSGTGEQPSAHGLETVRRTPESEAQVRAQLENFDVDVNKAACEPYNAIYQSVERNGVIGCTNVGGLRPSTVYQISQIKLACGDCTVLVTGGSENGHTGGKHSHGNGYKFDLRPNAELDAFLQRFESVGMREGDNGGPAYRDSCGNIYVRESTHWDIKVLSQCALSTGVVTIDPPAGASGNRCLIITGNTNVDPPVEDISLLSLEERLSLVNKMLNEQRAGRFTYSASNVEGVPTLNGEIDGRPVSEEEAIRFYMEHEYEREIRESALLHERAEIDLQLVERSPMSVALERQAIDDRRELREAGFSLMESVSQKYGISIPPRPTTVCIT